MFTKILKLKNKVHLQSNILSLGRTSHWVDPQLPEEERDAKLAELAEKDPEVERLKGISEEKSPFWKEGDEEEMPNWVIREVNCKIKCLVRRYLVI